MAWGQGDAGALERLVPVVDRELHRMAQRFMRRERAGHSLQATALVNEAYVRLVEGQRVTWRDRAHFLAVAAQAMRRVLVDHAVGRRTQKRGGARQRVPLEDVPPDPGQPIETLLALDAALGRLEAVDVRLTRVVECRYFGGMSVEETAQALQVSAATIKRDWSVARAWLNRELRGVGR